MFHFENVTNIKTLSKVSEQSSDIKLLAGNKIRIKASLIDLLELKDRKILVQRIPTGELFITSTDKESKEGRPVNAAGEFSHEVLSTLLKGSHSEWIIDPTFEAVMQEDLIYYKLALVVDGAPIRKELQDALPTHVEIQDVALDEQEVQYSTEEVEA